MLSVLSLFANERRARGERERSDIRDARVCELFETLELDITKYKMTWLACLDCLPCFNDRVPLVLVQKALEQKFPEEVAKLVASYMSEP